MFKTVTLTLAALAISGTAAMAQYYIPPPSVPQNVFGQPPVTYQNIGGNTYGSNGTVVQHIGNNDYINQPGQQQRVCQHIGNNVYCN